MNTQKPVGIKRVILAFGHSCRGLLHVWKNEAAFRQECFLAIILIPLALWLDVTGLEKAVMISTVILVLIVEILNSAIEAVVDRIGLEHNTLSGHAKDMGSAAVAMALLLIPIVWLLVLF